MNRLPNWCVDILVLGDAPEKVAAASRRALSLFEQPVTGIPVVQNPPLQGFGAGIWLPSFCLYRPRFEQRADGQVNLVTYDARMESWIRGLARIELDVSWLVLMRQATFFCPHRGQPEASVTAHVHLPVHLDSQEAHVRLNNQALSVLLPTLFPVLSSWDLIWNSPEARDPLALELITRSSVEDGLLAHARAQHLHAVWPDEVSQVSVCRL